MNGWINLDKPEGIYSTKALNYIKHRLKESGLRVKIGHAGTLDPMAEGVLPIAIGNTTKLIEYLADSLKAYTFTIKWRESTDSIDREGKVIATSTFLPSHEEVLNAANHYSRGYIEQVPPAFSAIRVNGKRAYSEARKGNLITLSSRQVYLSYLNLISHENGTSTFQLECGKGFYVRALARDMISHLKAEGHVIRIIRTRVGNFHLDESTTLNFLQDNLQNGDRQAILCSVMKPSLYALNDILVQKVNEREWFKLQNGQKVPLRVRSAPKIAATYKDELVAICKSEKVYLQPLKVFKTWRN